ncbi:hypothetical protein PVAP13_9NG149873 [Panicum virgatum]|uniref:Uncharacterized protein n=1 Tax=Panicum virgatum TaxID=38727 RepID=A0A8T0MGP8_PANVG|nr:hypothetical protein PVAP13_9NG149873 [Panicum virgatum]
MAHRWRPRQRPSSPTPRPAPPCSASAVVPPPPPPPATYLLPQSPPPCGSSSRCTRTPCAPASAPTAPSRPTSSLATPHSPAPRIATGSSMTASPLVGKRVRSKDADYALESIGALWWVIPEIWGAAAAGDGSERSDHGIDKMPMRSDLDSIIQPTSI